MKGRTQTKNPRLKLVEQTGGGGGGKKRLEMVQTSQRGSREIRDSKEKISALG